MDVPQATAELAEQLLLPVLPNAARRRWVRRARRPRLLAKGLEQERQGAREAALPVGPRVGARSVGVDRDREPQRSEPMHEGVVLGRNGAGSMPDTMTTADPAYPTEHRHRHQSSRPDTAQSPRSHKPPTSDLEHQ